MRFIKRIFSPPYRLWDPPSLQCNGYHGAFLGVKWPGCEVKCPLPCRAEVKNECSYITTPTTCLQSMERRNFNKMSWQLQSDHTLLTSFFNCTGYILFNEMGKVSWMVNMQGLCLPNSFSPPIIVTKMLHMYLNSIHHYQCQPPHFSLSNDPMDVCLPTSTHIQPTWDNDSHPAAQELSCLLSNSSLLCKHERPMNPTLRIRILSTCHIQFPYNPL